MTVDPLEQAAATYRMAVAEESEAKAALLAAQARRREAAAKVAQTRAPLADEIVRAARSGRRQVEITKVTGYNRERVRQICRTAGIEPE